MRVEDGVCYSRRVGATEPMLKWLVASHYFINSHLHFLWKVEQPQKTISTVSNIRFSPGQHSPLLFRPFYIYIYIFKEMGQALVQQACTCNALTMQQRLLHIQYCMANKKNINRHYTMLHWCIQYSLLMYGKFKWDTKVWINDAFQLMFAFRILGYWGYCLLTLSFYLSCPLCFDMYQAGWECSGIAKYLHIFLPIWESWHFNFRRQSKCVTDNKAASVSVPHVQSLKCRRLLI